MTDRDHAQQAAYDDALDQELRDHEDVDTGNLLGLTDDEDALMWDLLRAGQAHFVNHKGPVNKLMDKLWAMANRQQRSMT